MSRIFALAAMLGVAGVLAAFTVPQDACPDDPEDDAWPPDFNNDRTVNVLDVLMFPPHMGCSLGRGCYDNRFDLNVNDTINILDVMNMPPYLGTQCT